MLYFYAKRNVNYACRPKAFGGEPLTVAKLESDGWELVFRATAGNGEIPFNSWTNGNTVSINYFGFCIQLSELVVCIYSLAL